MNTQAHTTDSLWTQANTALHAGDWSTAREIMEEMMDRRDNRDALPTLDVLKSTQAMPTYLRSPISDRIRAVNLRVR